MQYIMQTLIPCIKETGKVIAIGTRWMIGDVPERLKNNPAWNTVEISAIQHDPLTGERRSYWNDYWSLERLDAKKAEMNNDALFNIMYMNDPTAMTAALFTMDSLSNPLPSPLPAFKVVGIGVDLAIGQKTEHDFHVFAAVGVDDKDNYYLLDMQRMKAQPDQVVKALGEFADKIAFTAKRLDYILIENIGFQTLFMPYANLLRADLPLRPHIPKGDKHHRASLVSSMALTGRFFVNQNMPMLPIMQSEWLNFPLHRHDDTLDAVSLMMQYQAGGISLRKVRNIKSPMML